METYFDVEIVVIRKRKMDDGTWEVSSYGDAPKDHITRRNSYDQARAVSQLLYHAYQTLRGLREI